jgi:methionine-S-sulfoxide reductase
LSEFIFQKNNKNMNRLIKIQIPILFLATFFFFFNSTVFGNQKVGNPLIQNNQDTLTLGGGCYWCVEAVYEKLIGVKSVVSGFSGGTVTNPSYKEVCMGNTGHAEVVQIIFNKKETSLEEILKVFFTVHDPTTFNRQGADEGEQYRSVIFYRNEKQRRISKEIINELNKQKVYDRPIVTQVVAFDKFYPADQEHQNYYQRNKEKGYCRMVIQPKLEKFEKVFKNRIKKD